MPSAKFRKLCFVLNSTITNGAASFFFVAQSAISLFLLRTKTKQDKNEKRHLKEKKLC